MLGNGQIGADRSPISLKFSHTTLLKNSRNTVLQEAMNSVRFLHLSTTARCNSPYSNPFSQAKAKTVTGREEWRGMRDGDEMRNRFLPSVYQKER
jgi:hypothetical protein